MYKNWGEDPLPYYEPPVYGPDTLPNLSEDYPFMMITGAREQNFFHSEHKQVPSLRKITPWPMIDINSEDAQDFGIEEGDWVEISSPYGHIRQKARVTPTMKKGVVHCMHGFWYPEQEADAPNLYGNWKSNVNMLMPNSVNGKLGFGNTFKQMMVSIRKVDDLGGPNDPDANGIVLEPSRQAEFTVQQKWRPADEPTDKYLQK